jgi:hypothetical protein
MAGDRWRMGELFARRSFVPARAPALFDLVGNIRLGTAAVQKAARLHNELAGSMIEPGQEIVD